MARTELKTEQAWKSIGRRADSYETQSLGRQNRNSAVLLARDVSSYRQASYGSGIRASPPLLIARNHLIGE